MPLTKGAVMAPATVAARLIAPPGPQAIGARFHSLGAFTVFSSSELLIIRSSAGRAHSYFVIQAPLLAQLVASITTPPFSPSTPINDVLKRSDLLSLHEEFVVESLLLGCSGFPDHRKEFLCYSWILQGIPCPLLPRR